MPPDGGGRYLKFASEAWGALYRARIASIIDNARQHNVSVIWIGPPNMRKQKLSQGMAYLNQLYRKKQKKREKFTFLSMICLNMKKIFILIISVMVAAA